MGNCTGVNDVVWVAGIHGLPGNPCAAAGTNFNGDINGHPNINAEICNLYRLPIICEDMPVVNVTETVFSVAVTVTFGQTTTTATSLRTRAVRRVIQTRHLCHKRTNRSKHNNPNLLPSTSNSTDDSLALGESSDDTYSSWSWEASSSDSRNRHMLPKAAVIQSKIQNSQSPPIWYGQAPIDECMYWQSIQSICIMNNERVNKVGPNQLAFEEYYFKVHWGVEHWIWNVNSTL